MLDFFRHFIVPSPYIYIDFSYYLLGYYIEVILPQAKLEHFIESAIITKAYIIGTGYIYRTFYINSELYL